MPGQVATPSRALMPDYLRLIALFGIVVVNVQFIGFSVLHGFADPVAQSPADAVTLWLVNGLALLKTYGLFSFMFGVGLGFLMRSAARRGLAFGKLYRNRMLGLLGLGLLHGCLFFPGDILVIYAVTGSILYLLRDWPVRRLVAVGAGLLVLQPMIALPLLLAPSETPPEFFAIEQNALGAGGFLDAVMFRTVGFLFTLPVFLLVQGVSALGWFCLGLAAVRAGMIDRADHALWARARRVCLWPGVALSLAGAALWQWGPAHAGAALTVMIAPVATLGYLGAIAALARPPGPIMSRVLAAGGSSLSIYLGQSIVLSAMFAAYGLGLWEEVSRPVATLIALAVTLGLILGLVLWHGRVRQGPFEWVLRRITHAGRGR
ncbi:MAG: DUF418 domain-containing protein [Alphaproteobacteria bacterium]|jgi:uncharacterized protein|nr:DUF418 domain-containing protein [Alphaproteobacteria bacterium]